MGVDQQALHQWLNASCMQQLSSFIMQWMDQDRDFMLEALREVCITIHHHEGLKET